MMEKELIAGIDDSGRRLDRILRRALPDLPLSLIHRLLRTGQVTVNGVPCQAAARIAAGSRICVREEAAPLGYGEKNQPPRSGFGPPDKSPSGLCILREGDGLLIVNKPSGIAVHSHGRGVKDSGKNRSGPACLDAQVRAYLRDKLPPSLSFRPGPLHRLDQMSSGIIVFSTGIAGARAFSVLMRERRLRKTYLALADGRIEGEEIWEESLFRDTVRGKTLAVTGEQADRTQAKPARTRVFPLAFHPPYSLIALEIETGRTHQIRAQAAFHGHPLAGDRKYGGSFQSGGPLLHAFSLGFPAEECPPELVGFRGETVSAPLPKSFLSRIQEIFGEILPLCRKSGS